MDLWDADQIAFVSSMGNRRAKAIWEGKLPSDYGKPSESEDSAMVLQWIRAKYERKKYFDAAAIEATRSEAASPVSSPNGATRKKKPAEAAPVAKESVPTGSAFPSTSAFNFLNGSPSQDKDTGSHGWGVPNVACANSTGRAAFAPSGEPSLPPLSDIAAAIASFDSRLGMARAVSNEVYAEIDRVLGV